MAGSAAAIYLVSSLGSSGKKIATNILLFVYTQNSGFLFFSTNIPNLISEHKKRRSLRSPKDVGLKRKSSRFYRRAHVLE